MKSLVNFENMMLLHAFNNIALVARGNEEFDDSLIRFSNAVKDVVTDEQRQMLSDFSVLMEDYDCFSDENLKRLVGLMVSLANDIEALNE